MDLKYLQTFKKAVSSVFNYIMFVASQVIQVFGTHLSLFL